MKPLPDLTSLGLHVHTVSAQSNPQILCYAAMRQDYTEGDVYTEMFDPDLDMLYWDPMNPGKPLSEQTAGTRVVEKCLKKKHFGPCYDDQTEILTSQGWVFFSELEGQKVAQWEKETNSISFVEPLAKVKIDYYGSIHNYSSRYLDMRVTPDHKMVTSHRGKYGWSKFDFAKSSEEFGRSFRIPVTGKLTQSTPRYSYELSALVGFYLGDGCTKLGSSFLNFRLKLSRKIEFLKSLGFEVEEMAAPNFKVFVGEELVNGLFSKLSQQKVKHLSLELGLTLNFEGLMHGLKNSDGTKVRGDLKFSYDSTSQVLLDNLQALATLNGVHGSINSNGKNGTRIPQHKPCSRICFTLRDYVRFEPTKNRTRDVTLESEKYNGFVYCVKVPTGAVVVRRNRKVFISGNCEHPQISVNVVGYPHTTMQQLRTHRTGITFDVQSGRYTGKRIVKAISELLPNTLANLDHNMKVIQGVFFIRPAETYRDRFSNGVDWDPNNLETRLELVEWYSEIIGNYTFHTDNGMPPEMARDLFIPYSIRQNFLMSCNLRSAIHLLEMRYKTDAELECQWFCDQFFGELMKWAPEIMGFWINTRGKKNLIAP